MDTEISPIFLLGAGRSGTKFLRDIIGVSSDIATIPYDVGYIWRYGNDDCPHDEFTSSMLTPKIEQYIKKTLPKLAMSNVSKPNASFFIEKSVPNTLRPEFLYTIYPNAKFIHLIRDGRAVSESAIRLWQAPPKRSYLLKKLKYFPIENYQYAFRYALSLVKRRISPSKILPSWGPRYSGINEDIQNLPLETVCARQWKKSIEISLSQLENCDKNNIIEVHYEDLMKDSKSLETICDFIGISDKSDIINNYEKKVVRTNTQKWKNTLTKKQLELINNEIETLNSNLGYKST